MKMGSFVGERGQMGVLVCKKECVALLLKSYDCFTSNVTSRIFCFPNYTSVKSKVLLIRDELDLIKLSFWIVITGQGHHNKRKCTCFLCPGWAQPIRTDPRLEVLPHCEDRSHVDRIGLLKSLFCMAGINSRLTRKLDFLPSYIFPLSCNHEKIKKTD